MSFIQSVTGKGYAPGWFLADAENCTRETREIAQNHAQVVTDSNGGKHVPMGAVYPSNDGNAVGIVYEDVDVSTGAMPGSVVTAGTIYADRLPASLESAASSALAGLGFKIITSAPKTARPADGRSLVALTVASVAGSASGKTKVTATGYTLGTGEKFVYKTHASTAPTAAFGAILGDGWTELTSADITATTGHKITVAAINAGGACVAAGNATVTSKT